MAVGGPAKDTAYMPEILSDILKGHINLGFVFDFTTDLNCIEKTCCFLDEHRGDKIACETIDKREPHVIVKFWQGKPEQLKKQISEEIVKDVFDCLKLRCGVSFGGTRKSQIARLG
jgi:hypothetical protein